MGCAEPKPTLGSVQNYRAIETFRRAYAYLVGVMRWP